MAETYTPPKLCVGTFSLTSDCAKLDSATQENQVAENIEIGGAIINVFPLRGIHSQGQLIDLIGSGHPLSGGSESGFSEANAFNISVDSWRSAQLGTDIVVSPSYLGYDFGTKKTWNNQEKYSPAARVVQHITTMRIQQGPLPQNRVIQARIERSDGSLSPSVSFTGVGNGQISALRPGVFPRASQIIVMANSANEFACYSSIDGFIKNISLRELFANNDTIFSIEQGSIPFQAGDTFTITLETVWLRVDVVNLPDTSNLETISIRQSVPSAMWRIVPLMFNGGTSDYWEVLKLEMMDYTSTSLDTIQDLLFLENRDRDYSNNSIAIKCSYQPMDVIGDLGKFGFSILDSYAFTCSFARMVELLGRPIVIGDIIEVSPEVQYDHNLKAVKKYLEVTDCGWAAEGFTPGWKPLLYRFQASQVKPSQENRDIFGTGNDAIYNIDDQNFFDQISQIETTPILISETTKADAKNDVPETGSDGGTTIASGMPMKPHDTSTIRDHNRGHGDGRGEYDGRDMYIEDALPPDGLPYGEGYTLPDMTSAQDGDYFRLNYPQESGIPSRLFKFSSLKYKWIYVETDMRKSMSSHKPSLRNALVSLNKRPLDKL